MSKLVKKRNIFFLTLLKASVKQQKKLILNMTSSQVKAVVQIIYNVLHGGLQITKVLKERFKRCKKVIRKLVQKKLSQKKNESY